MTRQHDTLDEMKDEIVTSAIRHIRQAYEDGRKDEARHACTHADRVASANAQLLELERTRSWERLVAAVHEERERCATIAHDNGREDIAFKIRGL